MGTCRDGAPGCCPPASFAARTTRASFEGAVERWLKWAWAEGRRSQPREESLTAYLRWFALNASGPNMERTAMQLLRVYRGELAKEANIRNPREFQAADAMPRAVLLQLVEGARALKHLMPIERTALDALVVAFSTVSGGRSWRCVWRTCRRTGGR